MFSNTVGLGEAQRSLPYGTLYSVEDALRVRLVDEVCEPDQLEDRTQAFLQQGMRIAGEIFYFATKLDK